MFLFKRKNKQDFAATFAQIERDINEITEKQSRMCHLRDRMLRWSWYLVYMDIAYAIGGMYLFLLTPLPLLAITALFFIFRKSVFALSNYYLSSGDRQLSTLRARQQDTLQEMTTITKFNELKALHDKYSPAQTSRSKDSLARRDQSTPSKPANGPVNMPQARIPVGQMTQPVTPLQQQQGSLSQQTPKGSIAIHTSPTFVDRLLDRIVGSSSDSNSQKYALICVNCYEHNGLALPSEYFEKVFRCFKCGFLNGKDPSRPSTSQHQFDLISEPSSSPARSRQASVMQDSSEDDSKEKTEVEKEDRKEK